MEVVRFSFFKDERGSWKERDFLLGFGVESAREVRRPKRADGPDPN